MLRMQPEAAPEARRLRRRVPCIGNRQAGRLPHGILRRTRVSSRRRRPKPSRSGRFSPPWRTPIRPSPGRDHRREAAGNSLPAPRWTIPVARGCPTIEQMRQVADFLAERTDGVIRMGREGIEQPGGLYPPIQGARPPQRGRGQHHPGPVLRRTPGDGADVAAESAPVSAGLESHGLTVDRVQVTVVPAARPAAAAPEGGWRQGTAQEFRREGTSNEERAVTAAAEAGGKRKTGIAEGPGQSSKAWALKPGNNVEKDAGHGGLEHRIGLQPARPERGGGPARHRQQGRFSSPLVTQIQKQDPLNPDDPDAIHLSARRVQQPGTAHQRQREPDRAGGPAGPRRADERRGFIGRRSASAARG